MGRLRRPGHTPTPSGALVGLQQHWDAIGSTSDARALLADLERSGFDAVAELRLVDSSPAQLYRRLLA